MFREIRTSEKVEVLKREEELAYKKIKPQNEMTDAEANAIVMHFWNQMILEAGGEPF